MKDYDEIIASLNGPTRIICIEKDIACVWTTEEEQKQNVRQLASEEPELVIIETDNDEFMKAFVPSEFVEPRALSNE